MMIRGSLRECYQFGFARKTGKLGGVPQNGHGGDYNTRQLSDKVIAAALLGSS